MEFCSPEEAQEALERNKKLAETQPFEIKETKITRDDVEIAKNLTDKIPALDHQLFQSDKNEDTEFWKAMFYKQKGITDSLLKRLEKYES